MHAERKLVFRLLELISQSPLSEAAYEYIELHVHKVRLPKSLAIRWMKKGEGISK